jgi:hypothetical protein
MHERYLFPFVALALPWALQSWKNASIYMLVSVLFFLNMTVALAFHHPILVEAFHDSMTNTPVIIAGVQIIALLWMGSEMLLRPEREYAHLVHI